MIITYQGEKVKWTHCSSIHDATSVYFQKFDRMEVAGSLPKYDMETDISQMEAPTFTTIDR